MRPDVRIVRLQAEEWSRLRALRLRALADAPEAFGSTYEETAARPEDSWRHQVRVLATFVAVSDAADVGMVRAVAMPDDPSTAELLSMWVDPAARGHGVGEALVDAVLAWARAEGHRRVMLDVKNGNASAIALYRRAGFERLGTTPGAEGTEHRRVRTLRASG